MTIWRPTTSTLYNMVTWFTTLATSIESDIAAAVKANGKSVFATTTARDAYYTSPQNGDLAVISGTWPILQMYYNSAWHIIGPSDYSALQGTSGAQSIPNATATNVNVFTTASLGSNQRGGFAADGAGGGLVVPFTGLYQVTYGVTWAALNSAFGTLRGAFMAVNGTGDTRFRSRVPSIAQNTNTFCDGTVARVLLNANDVIGLTVEQSSGAALSMSSASLSAVFLGS